MKTGKQITAVLGRMLLIALSVQILWGLLWMLVMFTGLQQFGESTHYWEACQNFVCDEYTGILYPVLLAGAKGMEKGFSIPYPYFVYIIQLLVGSVSGYCFLDALSVKRADMSWYDKLWGSLVLLTFPMSMQCHMAILPNSLAASCFLLEMGFLIKMTEKGSRQLPAGAVKACIAWLCASLLLPEYFYLGVLPLVLAFGYAVLVELRLHSALLQRVLWHGACLGLLLVVSAGSIMGIHALTQTSGSYGRAQRSVEAAWFRRTASFWVMEKTEVWPQDMRACFTEEELAELGNYPDNIERILQPRLEKELGSERARELYRTLSAACWQENRAEILHQMLWDSIGYTLPPVAMQLFLRGRGYDSYVGMNYDIMRRKAPELTGSYIAYSNWCFAMCLVLMLLIMVLSLGSLLLVRQKTAGMRKAAAKEKCREVQKSAAEEESREVQKAAAKEKCREVHLMVGLLCLVAAGGMIVWYTLQGAAMWDYKNALFVGQLWLGSMIVLAERKSYGTDFTGKE